MDIPWQLCRTIGPLTLHSQEIPVFSFDLCVFSSPSLILQKILTQTAQFILMGLISNQEGSIGLALTMFHAPLTKSWNFGHSVNVFLVCQTFHELSQA